MSGGSKPPKPDIWIADPNAADTAAYPYMITPGSTFQDLTPASTRRVDGDARFESIKTESLWVQNDFSAGMGLRTGSDPNSYLSGAVDAQSGNRLACPQDVENFSHPSGWAVLRMWYWAGTDRWYAVMFNTTVSAYRIFWTARTMVVWNEIATNLPSPPQDVTIFQGKAYISYSNGQVQSFDHAANTVSAMIAAGGNIGVALAPYLTFLYGVRLVAGTYELARWDPVNGDIKKVATFSDVGGEKPVAMRAAFGQLYITFSGSLWQWTSENGNLGQLVGPLDRWAYDTTPAGSTGRLEVFQGAIIYTSLYSIRRYVPGGSPRVLWPTLPQSPTWGSGWGSPVDMVTVGDQLYISLADRISGSTIRTDRYRVAVYTGKGMHLHCDVPMQQSPSLAATSTGDLPRLIANRYGTLMYFFAQQVVSGSNVPNKNMVRISTPSLSGDGMIDAGTLWNLGEWTHTAPGEWTSSWITMGMDDLLKVVRQFQIAGLLPFDGGGIAASITFNGRDFFPLTAQSALPRQATPGDLDSRPEVVIYRRAGNEVSVFKAFRIRLNLTPGTYLRINGPNGTPQVFAVMAVYNPVLPVRNGVRLTIDVAGDVFDHARNRLYPSDADVAAALARVSALRTDTGGKPLILTWLDGKTYEVRANTRTVKRMDFGNAVGNAFHVTLDLQEIS